MAILEPHAKLSSRQGFDDLAFHLYLIFFFGHNSSNPAVQAVAPFSVLFTRPCILAAFNTANGLLLLHTAKFTLRNEPALAADGAQYTAFHYLFAEAFEQ
jgi:hypothetical protein